MGKNGKRKKKTGPTHRILNNLTNSGHKNNWVDKEEKFPKRKKGTINFEVLHPRHAVIGGGATCKGKPTKEHTFEIVAY